MPNIAFGDKIIKTRHLMISDQSKLLCGDYIVVKGKLCRIETIQRNCPRITNLNAVFTAYFLRLPNGEGMATESLFGRRDVWRETK